MKSGGKNNLLITNARLIDGTGSPPRDRQTISIENGRLTGIGDGIGVRGARTIDIGGATVMPGLIDAHVHLQSVPGAPYRDDSDRTLDAYRYHHLRAYLACGVTTVLDNGISPEMIERFETYYQNNGAGPNIFALGPAFYPPGGYLDNGLLTPWWGPHWPPSGSAEDICFLFEQYKAFDNIVGVKMLLEPGFGPVRIWPIHSEKLRKIIVEEAEKRGLSIHVHAYHSREQAIGLEMGAHCFAHSGFLKRPPSRRFIREIKKRGAYLTTTLASTIEQTLVQFDLKRLDDPLLRLTVPEEQLTTARELANWEKMNFTLLRTASPKWMPDAIVKLIKKMVNMEKEMKKCVINASDAILTLHGEGIPIVVGTDSSNWPVFINFFHGPSTIRELELLSEAGMAPMDIILSATRIPARMMRQDHDIGTVEIGKRADLIIVKEDPLKNISVLKEILWTIKDGVPKTPGEWMKS